MLLNLGRHENFNRYTRNVDYLSIGMTPSTQKKFHAQHLAEWDYLLRTNEQAMPKGLDHLPPTICKMRLTLNV